MWFLRAWVRNGGIKQGRRGRQCRGVLWAGQCSGPLAFSAVELSEEPYEMHLRAVCLQNKRGKHLFHWLPPPSDKGSPAGIRAPAFWGCTWMSPRWVSAGTPCCMSGKLHSAGLGGSVQLPGVSWWLQQWSESGWPGILGGVRKGPSTGPPCSITRSLVFW